MDPASAPGTAPQETPTKRNFPQISPRAFQHPLDRTALAALQKVPGLDWVIRKFLTAIGERQVRLYFLASAVRVTKTQFKRVRKLYDEACWILDIEDPPELYISQDPIANAMAVGMDRPFIVVYSGLVDMLTDEELQCVLGHELGHVLSGHALYRTMLVLLIRMTLLFTGIPLGIVGLYAIILALLEWSRKAELTGDRAGLLVAQDLAVAHRVLMKLSGGKHTEECSVEEFQKQANEYESYGDLLDGVLKVGLLMWQTHPFSVLRVGEISAWVKSGEYDKVLNRDYPLRGMEPSDTFVENIKRTASTYKEAYDTSKDPLVAFVRDFTSQVAAAGSSAYEYVKKKAGFGAEEEAAAARKEGDGEKGK